MSEAQNKEQTLGIIAQYTKDLSFENINPISQIESSNEQPNIDVKLNINHEKGKQENVYVVSLKVDISAKVKDTTLFILELSYVGEFVIKGFEQSMIEPILYVECPRLLFPFARSIIASAVNEGGFPPLYLAPVNFVDLYQQQLNAKNQTKQ